MAYVRKIIFTKLSADQVVRTAKILDAFGDIQQRDQYCYLKIADDYIHRIQPLLRGYGSIDKPAYFQPPDDIGAHISVIYPEEQVTLFPENIGQCHRFAVCGLVKAHYGVKDYFVLSVRSPSLTAFRLQHHLTSRPRFKGQDILFHITVGVRDCFG